MSKDITAKNVLSFIKGNFLYYKDALFGRPKYIKEQILYRLNLCKDDCLIDDACIYCECPPRKKSHMVESCNNGLRFPNLMEEQEWIKYKEENDIKI
tara:strand:+ start:7932 stop:8222 length:291 start_codon:yes stop_codon:yes gene_type:complete